jgi:hypothetical protein
MGVLLQFLCYRFAFILKRRRGLNFSSLAFARAGGILNSVLARVRNWFDGAGWFVGGAVVLFVGALLAVVLLLQAPERLLWIGQQVTGTEVHGLVSYRWHGQSYAIAVPGTGSASAVTVYLDPGNPASALTNSIFDRFVAILLVGGPALAGGVLLVVGGTRNYRWRRRNAKRGGNDWWISKLPSS